MEEQLIEHDLDEKNKEIKNLRDKIKQLETHQNIEENKQKQKNLHESKLLLEGGCMWAGQFCSCLRVHVGRSPLFMLEGVCGQVTFVHA